jgi:uncharacterized protein (TIGR01319 family)
VDLICADFGSTFTKVAVISADGSLVGTASANTTIDTDVLDGLEVALRAAGVDVDSVAVEEIVACSSAGGGLRLAVIGYERAITAEAGYRVGLSAGARVVHVAAGELDASDVKGLIADRPDVVLLAGGTDGGNSEVLLANARALAKAQLAIPVVVAGNADVIDQVRRILRRGGVAVVTTSNVLPKIGVLDPRHAREAIRDVFIRHVIGGKHLSTRADLSTFVRAATPDAVLAGVELLSDGLPDHPGVGDVVVVDVGGATTDVYSVITPDTEGAELDREAVATLWRSRTVEGDLGVRWNAVGVVDAAVAERLIDAATAAQLYPAAEQRVANPALLPDTPQEQAIDQRLATLAATTALRRHARPQESEDGRYLGKDLRNVRLVVGSGGVLRHSTPATAARIVTEATQDPAGGWRHPERAAVCVDNRYVLAAAGLLRFDHPELAMTLLRSHLLD